MIKFYYIFLLCICTEFCFSQSQLVKQWDARFGGSDYEGFNDFQQTSDGGYILGGFSKSPISGDKTQDTIGNYDYWIVKIDAFGNKQWDKDFGGTDWEQFYSLQQTRDGGYILAGYSPSGIGGDKTDSCRGNQDYWIVKTDSAGNKQWDKTYGGTGNDFPFAARQTRDGGYIIGGYSLSPAGGEKSDSCKGSYDYWIVKTDSLGKKQWDKDYGGLASDRLTALELTKDGGYILGGYSVSGAGFDKSDSTRGLNDFWIIKIDSMGNKQWDKTFGSSQNDQLYSLQQTRDGGYVLAGWTRSGIGGDKTQATQGGWDYWMVKTDSQGNKQWDKDFGTADDEDDFGNVIQTTDGGYLLAGTSYSMTINGDKSENNLGVENIWLVKTNSVGAKQWDKTILTKGHDEVGLAIQAKDGCYVVGTHTSAAPAGYKTQPSQGGQDFWIVKFCDTTSAAKPSAVFISSDTAFCDEAGKCISFTDLSANNPTSWKWLFPGATPSFSNQQNPTNICYTNPGTYPVTLIVNNSGGSDSITISPMITLGTIPAKPVITVVGGDTLISTHAAHYQWYYNGGPIAAATDSFYVAKAGGTYAVRVTNDLGCSSQSDGMVITAVKEIESTAVSIYPNPTQGEFKIMSRQAIEAIDIFNILGEKVYSKIVNCESCIIHLHLTAGLYYLQLTDGVNRFMEKLIVE